MEQTPSQKPKISRTRKVLIWVFIITFWVFFYWYYDVDRASAPDEPDEATQKDSKT
jgi:hypothetical protein|tara:strand:- start:17 stop:184 length:168 start_codon:yes stop_codon:yes gene_type:complete